MNDAFSSLLRKQQSKQAPPIYMPEIIWKIVSTQKGWIIRQALKYTAVIGASATTWLTSNGVEISDPAAISAALATIVTGVAELLLSKAASKVAAK